MTEGRRDTTALAPQKIMTPLTRRRALLNAAGFSATCASIGMLTGCGADVQPSASGLFDPNEASLKRHTVPDWFKDAKFGVFIHWGPYSIPAFAPQPNIEEGKTGFKYNAYAEWYRNTMLFEDGPTAEFHRNTYGENHPYEYFGRSFNEALEDWDPDDWARLFKRSGARYVVLVAKHHDGFLLWPSATPNPHVSQWGTRRDVVGELAEAVRGQGLRFGVYYSGGVDWTFRPQRVDNFSDLFLNMPGKKDGYIQYANAQYYELIDRYRPDYLWNDIGYPSQKAVFSILAHYYNTVPDGLTNDRWISLRGFLRLGVFDRPKGMTGLIPPKPPVWDVRTPEYTIFDEILPFEWEATRGIGHSFGYNRAETEADLITLESIVQMLAQAASYNGNVLLNVGPRGDARIDPAQAARLESIGAWLQLNAAALQDTRPVLLPEQTVRVGAVKRGDKYYLLLLEQPIERSVKIVLPGDLFAYENAAMMTNSKISVQISSGEVTLTASDGWGKTPAIVALTKS
ncbi:MAG: alpha-L-fucosidase [Pseudomonadota bacterium]